MLASCNIITSTPGLRPLIPRETSVPGWELLHNTVLHTSKTAKNAPAGLREKISVSYRSFSNSQIMITLTIEKYAGPLFAFGRFSRIRGFSSHNRELRTYGTHLDSYISGKGLYARYNNYYLACEADNSRDRLRKDLFFFSSLVLSKLKRKSEPQSFPGYIKKFSLHDKTTLNRNSVIYSTGTSSQLIGLKDFFFARLTIKQHEKLVFFKDCFSTYKSIQTYKHIINSNKKIVITKSKDLETALLKKKNEFICVSRHSRYLFGIFNARSIAEGTKLIYHIYKHLK